MGIYMTAMCMTSWIKMAIKTSKEPLDGVFQRDAKELLQVQW